MGHFFKHIFKKRLVLTTNLGYSVDDMENDLAGHITDFLEYCEIDRNLSPLTVKMYAYYLNSFAHWMVTTSRGSVVANLTPDLIRDYRIYLSRYENPIKGPLKRSTQGYFLIAIRSFLRYMTKKGVTVLPPDQIELGKTHDRAIKFLDKSHLDQLLAVPDTSKKDGMRDRAILEMLFSTGLRVSELVKLDREKVNISTREFGVIGKGGHARVVFLSDRATQVLEEYLKSRQDSWSPLFIRYSGKINEENNGVKMRLTVRSIERLVEKYVNIAHLPINATPHTMRHSFATDLLMNGADLRSVQEMLGHKNVSTTQIYTHVTNKKLREIHEQFHGK